MDMLTIARRVCHGSAASIACLLRAASGWSSQASLVDARDMSVKIDRPCQSGGYSMLGIKVDAL